MQDYYKILELSKDASQEEIKQNYRALAKKWHPDANGNSAESEEKFKAINEAYSNLSTPEKRQEYDALFSNFQNSTKYDFDNFARNYRHANTHNNGEWEFTYTYHTRKNDRQDFQGNALGTILKGALQVAVGGLLFTFAGFFPLLGIYAIFSGISNIRKGISHL